MENRYIIENFDAFTGEKVQYPVTVLYKVLYSGNYNIWWVIVYRDHKGIKSMFLSDFENFIGKRLSFNEIRKIKTCKYI